MKLDIVIPSESIQVSLEEFKATTKNFDVCLIRRRSHLSGKMIAWGQKYLLRSMGYPSALIEDSRKWIHAFMIYRNKYGTCIESNPPKIGEFNISRHLDAEIIILRYKDGISLDEEAMARFSFQKYNGMKYDYGEYMVYPFFMTFGSSPGFWRKMWDTDKPVCSGFVIKMYNEMGKLLNLKDNSIMYTPACLLFIDQFQIVGRYIIKEETKSKRIKNFLKTLIERIS